MRKAAEQRSFAVYLKRWVVERRLAWLTAHRWLARDYERDPAMSEAFIRWAAINTMIRGRPATRQIRRIINPPNNSHLNAHSASADRMDLHTQSSMNVPHCSHRVTSNPKSSRTKSASSYDIVLVEEIGRTQNVLCPRSYDRPAPPFAAADRAPLLTVAVGAGLLMAMYPLLAVFKGELFQRPGHNSLLGGRIPAAVVEAYNQAH